MRMRRAHLSMRTEGITAFLKRIRRCSVDGRKRYESVDVNLFDKGAKTALFSFENGLVWTGRQLKETNVSAILSLIPSLHLRKHMKTLRKYVFSMFSLTYSGLLNVWWNLRKHKKPSGNWCLFYVSATGFALTNVLFQNNLPLAEIILVQVNIFIFSCVLKRTLIMCMTGRESS